MTRKLKDYLPDRENMDIGESVFLDPTVRMVGDVTIREKANILTGSIIEADKSDVKIGEESVVMDGASIKSTERHDLTIGERSLIGSGARLEGCKIGENSLVGIDAVVMEGAEIGDNAIVGTNAIVKEGTKVPDNTLVLGQPAEEIRDVSEEELDKIKDIRFHVKWKSEEYKTMIERGEEFDAFDSPKRPDDILDEEINLDDIEERNDIDELKKELEDMLENRVNE
ncbi:MAG: gamma carbonic anhydrase family protein [Thermoplasmatota archaeon]